MRSFPSPSSPLLTITRLQQEKATLSLLSPGSVSACIRKRVCDLGAGSSPQQPQQPQQQHQPIVLPVEHDEDERNDRVLVNAHRLLLPGYTESRCMGAKEGKYTYTHTGCCMRA